MVQTPSEATVLAWARLVRVSASLLEAVETELKAAGFPSLVWYNALLELGRAKDGRLRPYELERRMLLPQYSTSRLIDRLERAGLVGRLVCPDDRRGQVVAITDAGRDLRARMWPAYANAIERHVGAKLTCDEAQQLVRILSRLSEQAVQGGCGLEAEGEPLTD